jgi:exodeoxyribonuclease V alpha subunit
MADTSTRSSTKITDFVNSLLPTGPQTYSLKLHKAYSVKKNWCAVLLRHPDPDTRPPGVPEYIRASGQVVFSPLLINNDYSVEGEWYNDPTYGLQFKMTRVVCGEIVITEQTIAEFLKERVPAKQAKTLLQKYGTELVDALRDNTIPDFPCEKLYAQWNMFLEHTELCKELDELEIPSTYHMEIIDAWGTDCVRYIKENPYILMHVSGIGFKRADVIARKFNVQLRDPRRIAAAVEYSAMAQAGEGHTYTSAKVISQEASVLAEVEVDARMVDNDSLYLMKERDNIALFSLFDAENSSANLLADLAMREPIASPFVLEGEATIAEKLEEIKAASTLNLAQQSAFDLAQTSRVMVITGGPGTGKTHALKTIVESLITTRNTLGNLFLLAPTGKAAVRMKELIGYPAQTIHSLLQPINDALTRFNFSSTNPLPPGTYIVDECSMVNIRLFHSLITALPSRGIRVVLVGDADQLPAIGPGNVLHDIITSTAVPVVRFEEIVRNKVDSKIVVNAKKILEGKTSLTEGEDFQIVRLDETETIKRRIKAILTMENSLAQIITPTNKGDIGTVELNPYIQNILNSDGEQIRNTKFRVGDRIMSLRNNHETGIMNGDLGTIMEYGEMAGIPDGEADPETGNLNGMAIMWDSHGRRLHKKNFNEELGLAYAITIHKAQGAEFEHVVVVMHRTQYMMLKRNLIYTAVTRAKEKVTLIAAPSTISRAITTMAEERRTMLGGMLKTPYMEY